jgi:hypothetical protein
MNVEIMRSCFRAVHDRAVEQRAAIELFHGGMAGSIELSLA